jgi:hypothetical protein
MNKIKKIFSSLKVLTLRIKDNPRCLPNYLKVIYYYFRGTNHFLAFYKKIKILNQEETINYLINNNSSFVRFGTGEAQIAMGMGFYVTRSAHKADQKLVRSMNQLFEQDNVLVGLGERFISTSDAELKKEGMYEMFLRNRIFLRKKIKPEKIYGDAFAFRENSLDLKKMMDFLNKKIVVFVSKKNPNLEKVKFNNKKIFIEGPVLNAYSEYDKILNEVKETIEKEGLSKENCIFLISLGPAAKPLVIDIDKLGLIAWDVGVLFDDSYIKRIEDYQKNIA